MQCAIALVASASFQVAALLDPDVGANEGQLELSRQRCRAGIAGIRLGTAQAVVHMRQHQLDFESRTKLAQQKREPCRVCST